MIGLEMTNKEAAQILRNRIQNITIPRACGKSRMVLRLIMAFSKAIYLLENTPD